MSQTNFVPQIPYGTRDFLPQEAKRKRTIEDLFAKLFAGWGYDEVVTPTFEYLETLTVGLDQDALNNVFKFLDKNNRILALRPDMTTPISRVAATRLKEQPLPYRLFYMTNVFRYEQAQAGRQCEFYQAGVELMGAAGPAADAEIVALAAAALRKTGLATFQISLGQVDFINGIMAESELAPEQRQRLKDCLVRRDLVGLEETLQQSGLSAAVCRFLKRIPLLHGREDVLEQALQMVHNDTSRRAIANLADIYQLLTSYGVGDSVYFDLGIIRDFDYYTGMVFEGYTPGLGFPLCGGGRYDNMLGAMGASCPATGFAVGIERVLLALERQKIMQPAARKDVYIGWQDGKLCEAIAEAGKLRREQLVVEIAPAAETKMQAEASRQARGYKQLIYIGD